MENNHKYFRVIYSIFMTLILIFLIFMMVINPINKYLERLKLNKKVEIFLNNKNKLANYNFILNNRALDIKYQITEEFKSGKRKSMKWNENEMKEYDDINIKIIDLESILNRLYLNINGDYLSIEDFDSLNAELKNKAYIYIKEYELKYENQFK